MITNLAEKMSHSHSVTVTRKRRVDDEVVETALNSFIEDNLKLPANIQVSDDVLHKLQEIRSILSKKSKNGDIDLQ